MDEAFNFARVNGVRIAGYRSERFRFLTPESLTTYHDFINSPFARQRHGDSNGSDTLYAQAIMHLVGIVQNTANSFTDRSQQEAWAEIARLYPSAVDEVLERCTFSEK